MLEISLHDGPARLGKYDGQETPGILSSNTPIPFIPDEPMPYNVPKPLAEFSVNKTLEKAAESDETGLAVIHGSKYPELRVRCALELEKLGNDIPFIKTPFIPLLAYLGVDFFGADSGNFYAQLGQMTTPHRIYDLKDYQLYRFNQEELRGYNQNTMDFVLREVRENIRNKTLRNLVEERCCSSTETMTALRILDRDYGEYLDEYTALY